jgi:hypothetical protein
MSPKANKMINSVKLLLKIVILTIFSIPVHAGDHALSVKGGRLKIEGARLFFNDRLVRDSDQDVFSFSFAELTGSEKLSRLDRDIVLVNESVSASCQLYFFVETTANPPALQMSESFGTCDDGPAITIKGDVIYLAMNDESGRKRRFIYRNGMITKQ